MVRNQKKMLVTSIKKSGIKKGLSLLLHFSYKKVSFVKVNKKKDSITKFRIACRSGIHMAIVLDFISPMTL